MANENETKPKIEINRNFPPPPENMQEMWSSGIRKMLLELTDKYVDTLLSHDSTRLQYTSDVKYTENGKALKIGDGIWKTANKILLKRTFTDTRTFSTHTEAIIEENDSQAIYAGRLKFECGRISEIENIIARPGDFFFNPQGVLDTKDQDWETILPVDQRISRLALIAAANDYFDMFAHEPEVCSPFHEMCDRWENGTITTVRNDSFPLSEGKREHDGSPKGLPIYNHRPRRFLVDVETGCVAAYMHFANSLPDVHMFKLISGKIVLIHATVGPRSDTMGWPEEKISL